MKKSKPLIIAVSLLISLFLGVSTVLAADYFPLAVGNTWTYSPSFGAYGNRVDAITGEDTVSGVHTYIWNRQEAADDNYNEKRWIATDNSVLKVYKFWSNLGPDPAIIIDPPWVTVKSSPTVGDTSSGEFALGGGIVIKVTYFIESINDTVTVPAGTFSNCVRIQVLNEMTENSTKSPVGWYKEYYAPDVGLVIYAKYNANWGNTTTTQQLISYSLSGVCGTSNGQTFTSPPATNLCNIGSPSGISGTGPWSWICVGATTANCSAGIQTWTVTPSAGSGGSISPNSVQTVNHGATQSFTVTANSGYTAAVGGTCNGTLNGNTYTTNPVIANCTVSATFSATPVNGSCGSSNGQTLASAPTTDFCDAGSATAVTGSGPWSWTCAGSNGGSIASCSANLQPSVVDGSCGSANGQVFAAAPMANLCSDGTPTVVQGGSLWSWSCKGAGGGTNDSCSAPIQSWVDISGDANDNGHLDLADAIIVLQALTGIRPTGALASNRHNVITSFSFANPGVVGSIAESTHAITVTVPSGTDVTALTPAITHTGARLEPASGAAQDFTNPVVYSLSRDYTVTVAVAPWAACGDTLTYAGEHYPTVQIGTQCWFAKNLNTGTMVPAAGGQTASCSAVQKYCYDDTVSNCTTYGGLYTWTQAMCGSTTAKAQGICPAGWHIPTDPEFVTLTNYLASASCPTYRTGNSNYCGAPAGDRLKSAGLCQGRTPCGDSGFNGLMGGIFAGTVFQQLGDRTVFWTSSMNSNQYEAWRTDLLIEQSAVNATHFYSPFSVGESIRCLKDQ